MKTLQEMIEVMQAFERGEKIQSRDVGVFDAWHQADRPRWQWHTCDYRIAPKPKKKVKLLAMVSESALSGECLSPMIFATRNADRHIRLPQFDVEVEMDDE